MSKNLFRIKKIKLGNGLNVELIKIKKYSTVFAGVVAPVGSITSFGTIDHKNIPEGVAHFLEHRLFDTPQGDAFERLADLGCDANAFTTYNLTCYHFSTSEHLFAGLEILLDFTTHLTFNEEAVEREKQIIVQELNMYNDYPTVRLKKGLLDNLYCESPIKNEIGGTPKEVMRTTLEDLKTVFATFYHPEKLKLYIVGDYPQEIIPFLEKMTFDFPKEIPLYQEKKYQEPSNIKRTQGLTKMDIPLPLLAVGVKFPQNYQIELGLSLSTYHVLLDIIEQCLFDHASLLVKKLKKGHMYEAGFQGSLGSIVHDTVLMISSSAPNLESLYAYIKGFLNNPLPYLKKSDFARIKKSLYGQYLLEVSQPSGLFDNYIHLDQIGGSIEEVIAGFDKITFSHVQQVLKKIATLDIAFHVVSPVSLEDK